MTRAMGWRGPSCTSARSGRCWRGRGEERGEGAHLGRVAREGPAEGVRPARSPAPRRGPPLRRGGSRKRTNPADWRLLSRGKARAFGRCAPSPRPRAPPQCWGGHGGSAPPTVRPPRAPAGAAAAAALAPERADPGSRFPAALGPSGTRLLPAGETPPRPEAREPPGCGGAGVEGRPGGRSTGPAQGGQEVSAGVAEGIRGLSTGSGSTEEGTRSGGSCGADPEEEGFCGEKSSRGACCTT